VITDPLAVPICAPNVVQTVHVHGVPQPQEVYPVQIMQRVDVGTFGDATLEDAGGNVIHVRLSIPFGLLTCLEQVHRVQSRWIIPEPLKSETLHVAFDGVCFDHPNVEARYHSLPVVGGCGRTRDAQAQRLPVVAAHALSRRPCLCCASPSSRSDQPKRRTPSVHCRCRSLDVLLLSRNRTL
jgi:hypothetical protein